MTSVLGRVNSRSKVRADHKPEFHTHTQRHHVSLYGTTGAVSVWFAEALVVGFEVGLPQSAYVSEALAVGVESVFHISEHLEVYRSEHLKLYLH